MSKFLWIWAKDSLPVVRSPALYYINNNYEGLRLTFYLYRSLFFINIYALLCNLVVNKQQRPYDIDAVARLSYYGGLATTL